MKETTSTLGFILTSDMFLTLYLIYLNFSFCFRLYPYIFRKDFSAQHCLFSMLRKWSSTTDSKELFGELLTYLSKGFDCLSHDLLTEKNQMHTGLTYQLILKIVCKEQK